MSVLLGLSDGPLDPQRHRSSFWTNKAGGLPDWPPPVRGQSPPCRRCGSPSALVVQVYCPVDQTPTHRNLHLFACTAPTCSGLSESWTALRSQGPVEDRTGPGPAADPVREPDQRVTDWCDEADEWEEQEAGGAVVGAPCPQEKPAEGGGERVISDNVQDLPLQDLRLRDLPLQDLRLRDLPLREAAVFRPLFISVVEEADLNVEDDALRHAQELLREYESREGAVAAGEPDGGGGSQEKYEKMEAKHGDQVFGGFMKRISVCPRQILRYRRGGRPLFVSSPPSHASRLAPPCGGCGAARTFELQLMPALVSLLRRSEPGSEADLEFGTVLVFTCSRSCWAPGRTAAVDEFCYVQTDPDQQLFH